MQDGVTKSIFAHLIPVKRVDFSSCEKVVKMIVKELATWGYHRVVFRCDNEPSILALLRAVKLAWTGHVVQETSAEGDPQSNSAAESSVNVVKGHVRSIKLAVESASGVEVPADHDLLMWLVSHATSMHRRFSVGRDGKTAHERNVGRRAVPPLAQFGGRVWWMPLQPSNRRLGPLDSRFEQGRYLGPMDGSNTVLVTASGVVKARTIKRLPPGERWTGSLLDEAWGVRRAPLRRTDFEQFGYTDNCPGCANARAGREQAVDHSEQCRSRMEAILMTTNEGHERLEQARDRFAQASARDIALRAKGSSLLRHRHQVTTGKAVAAAAVRCRLRLRHRQLNHHQTGFGTRNRNDRCNRGTTGRAKEAQGASRSASSRGQQ